MKRWLWMFLAAWLMIGLTAGTSMAHRPYYGPPVIFFPWVVPFPRFYYPPPPVVVPPPIYVPPPAYVPPPSPLVVPPSAQQEPAYWYYCENPKGYYPYITSCPGGWMRVVPPSAPPPDTSSGDK